MKLIKIKIKLIITEFSIPFDSTSSIKKRIIVKGIEYRNVKN